MAVETIVEAFHRVADEHGGLIAIEYGNEKVSYRQLAQKVARATAAFGVLDNEIVGVSMLRSPDLVVALFGLWQCGKVPLVLDPEWPDSRIESICRHAGTSILVTELPSESGGESLSSYPHIESPAYLIYTSGTSGKPKGVLVAHRGLVPMLETQIREFKLKPGDRSYWMNGVAFDASISDIGTALLSGATLVMDRSIVLSNLLEVLDQRKITYIDLPPALLPILDVGAIPDCLETVVIGGMIAKPEAIRQWAKRVRVINVYGPTEATICTSLTICDENWELPFIGQPIDGITYHVDTESDELLIEGAGVAVGYHNDPELTAERFQNGVYRSGDRVRKHESGNYEFLGRIDRQMKIHGKLVCPEEIEQALLAHSHVEQCVVYQGRCGALSVELKGEADSVELQEYLSQRLPSWMIPKNWSYVERLQLSHAGKPKARNKTAALLDELCGTRDLRALDSLAIIEFIIEAKKRGYRITPEMIAESPGIVELAAALDAPVEPSSSLSTEYLLDRINTLEIPDRSFFQRSSEPSHFLVTGASGFLGSLLTYQLSLLLPKTRITCLIRAGGQQRFHSNLEKHGVVIAEGRVEFIEGDICDPLQIPNSIDAILHSAADTSLAKTFDQLYSSNVLGTRNMLELAVERRAAFHYVSTLSVFVDALPLPELCLETDALNLTQQVFGGYAQSKWLAEKLVNRYRELIPISIYRPGLLTPNSNTGFHPPNDWFAAFASSYCGSLGSSETCDDTPVDFAARVVAELVVANRAGNFHVTTGQRLTAAMIKDRYGSLGVAEGGSFDPCEIASDEGAGNSPFRLFKASKTRFSTKHTDSILDGSIY